MLPHAPSAPRFGPALDRSLFERPARADDLGSRDPATRNEPKQDPFRYCETKGRG